ncbi:hypothetical protein GCM10011519_11640 [Marmoricola endophyticus]|uniref:HTH OST-type domain-containing protein n=1 Tax=Marmoricola endophyticus TaxID=2040280 RepID=A0A917BHQ2_9ACTN|nr:hypothetical protein GCM10011519_11640 [Marmoricola endophyticus]
MRRAYGNWTKPELKGWAGVLHERAIRPVQQYDYSKGKNASDMAMVVEAMALLYTERPDAFAIVSSDADFTPLVMHLREKGLDVYGYGQKKAPEPFQSACSRFTDLNQIGDEDDEPAPAAASAEQGQPTERRTRLTTNELKGDSALVALLRKAVASAADESGWATVNSVGNRIANQSSQDPRNYGYASWSKLLKASELFEVKDEGTSHVSVRDPRER